MAERSDNFGVNITTCGKDASKQLSVSGYLHTGDTKAGPNSILFSIKEDDNGNFTATDAVSGKKLDPVVLEYAAKKELNLGRFSKGLEDKVEKAIETMAKEKQGYGLKVVSCGKKGVSAVLSTGERKPGPNNELISIRGNDEDGFVATKAISGETLKPVEIAAAADRKIDCSNFSPKLAAWTLNAINNIKSKAA